MSEKKFKIKNASPCDKLLTGIRLKSEDHAILTDLSKINKITMQEVARQMIRFAIDNMNGKDES